MNNNNAPARTRSESAYHTLIHSTDRTDLRSTTDDNKPTFRLSQSGYNPQYRLLKALGKFVEHHDESRQMLFYQGHTIAQAYLKQLSRTLNRRILYEVEVKTPYGDEGHIDAWIPSKRKIVEIKTCGKTTMENAPLFKDICQVQAYMYYWNLKESLKRPSRRNMAEIGELVYIGRNGEGYREFPIYPNFKLQQEINEILFELHGCVEYWPIKDMWKKFDLSDYYTPPSFLRFLEDNKNWPELDDLSISYSPEAYDERRNNTAVQWYLAKKRGDKKAEKEWTKKLMEFFEAGETELALPYQQMLMAKKGESKRVLDFEKAAKCGAKTMEQMQRFIEVKEGSWRKSIKKINPQE